MSTHPLLHHPASGSLTWELVLGTRVLRTASTSAKVAVTVDGDGSELFTRTSGSYGLSTELTEPEPGQLVEALGPLTLVFGVERNPNVVLNHKCSRLFGVYIPRSVLNVSAQIQTADSPTCGIRTHVQISILSTLHFRYVAKLTTGISS